MSPSVNGKLISRIFLILAVCSCSSPTSRMMEIVDQYEQTELMNGSILVAKGNSILIHRMIGYADLDSLQPFDSDTKFRIASLTKPMTAYLIHRLIQEGRVFKDSSITYYLPEFSLDGAESINISHLLHHSSGLISSLKAEIEKQLEQQPHQLDQLVEYAAEAPLKFAPGSDFSYSNFGYALLARVAEVVTGKSYNRLIEEYIFKPAGMDNTIAWASSEKGQNQATGYEYDLLAGYEESSPLDLSYATGYGNILSTPHDLMHFIEYISHNSGNGWDTSSPGTVNSLGWFIQTLDFQDRQGTLEYFEHSGSINGFGAHMLFAPTEDLSIIVLKNFRSNNYLQPIYASALSKALLLTYLDEKVQPVRRSIALDLALHIGSGEKNLDSCYLWLKDNSRFDYNVNETELNKLGIELLFKYEAPRLAAQVFRINMLQYPSSYNVYDSYAHALLASGDSLEAIKTYRKGFKVFEGTAPNAQSEQDLKNYRDAQSKLEYLLPES